MLISVTGAAAADPLIVSIPQVERTMLVCQIIKVKMKKTLFYTYLAAFILFMVFPLGVATGSVSVRPLSPTGTKVTGSQWLFVIGIDTYISWPRLNTAVNDAKSLRSVLLSKYHFDEAICMTKLQDQNLALM